VRTAFSVLPTDEKGRDAVGYREAGESQSGCLGDDPKHLIHALRLHGHHPRRTAVKWISARTDATDPARRAI
jgi:hypothetical protein